MSTDSSSLETIDDIRVRLRKCMQEVEDMTNVYTTFSETILEQLNNSKLIKDVNRLDSEFTDMKRSIAKIYDIGQILINEEDLFRNLSGTMSIINENLMTHNKKLSNLRKREKKMTDFTENLQKQITGNDNVVNGRLDAIEEFDFNESERLAKLRKSISDELREENARLLSDAIEGLRNELNEEHQKLIDELRNEYQNSDAESKELIRKLRDDHTAATERIEQAKKEAIDQSAENVLDIRQKLDEHHQKLEKLFENTDELENSIQETNVRIDNLCELVDNNKKELDNADLSLQESIEEFKAAVGSQNEKNKLTFENIKNDCALLHEEDARVDTKLDNAIAERNQKIKDSIEKAANDLQTNTDRLNQRIDESNDRFDAFVNKTRENVQKINDLINEVHDTETGMKEEHNALAQLLNDKEAAILKTQKELLDLNDKMSQKVRDCNIRNEDIASKMAFLQGEEDLSMTDLKESINKAAMSLEKTQNELKEGLAETRGVMVKEIQDANEISNGNVTALRKELETARESMAQQLEVQIKVANDSFNEAVKGINEDSAQTRESLNNFLGESTMNLNELIRKLNGIDENLKTTKINFQQESDQFALDVNQQFDEFKAYIGSIGQSLENRKKEHEAFSNTINQRLDDVRAKNVADISKHKKATDKMKKHIQEVVENSFNILISADKETDEKVDAINDTLRSLLDSTESKIKAGLKNISLNYDDKFTSIDTTFQDVNSRIAEIKGTSGKSFDDLVDDFKKLENDSADRLTVAETKIDKKLEQFTYQVEQFETNTVERNDQTLKALLELQNKVHVSLSENEKKVDDQLKNAKSDLMATINSVDSKIDDFVGPSNLKVSDIMNRILDVETTNKTAIKENFAKSQEVETLFNESNKKFISKSDKLEKLVEVRKSEIENLKIQVQTNLNEIKAVLTDDQTKLLKQLSDAQNDNKKRFDDAINVVAEIKKTIDDVKLESKNLVNELDNKSVKLIVDSQKSIQNSVNLSFDSVNEKFTALKKSIEAIRGKDGNDIPTLVKKINNLEQSINQQLEDFREHTEKTNQDINALIDSNATANGERVSQLQEDYNAKIESAKKSSEEANKASIQKVEKVNTYLKSKLKKLEEKIVDIHGGAEGSLKDLFNIFSELNMKISEAFTKTSTELNMIKSRQEKQPGEIKDQLTNDFKSIINLNKTDNELIAARMDEIIEKQKECATVKALQDVDAKVLQVRDVQINELKENDEKIQSELTEYLNKFAAEVSAKIKSHRERLSSLKESINAVNGGATESLQQAHDRIKQLEKDLANDKAHIFEIEESTTKNLRDTQSRFDTETETVKTSIETIRQDYIVKLKKITDDSTENSRVNTQKITMIETMFHTLEGNVKEQIKQQDQIFVDKFNAFAQQTSNKVSKIDSDLVITKSSLEKVNNQQISFSRSTKDSLESLKTEIDSRFSLAQKALDAKHIEISNEISKVLSEKSEILTKLSNDINERATQSITQLRNDFENLRGGSCLSLPMLVEQIERIANHVKEQDKKTVSELSTLNEKVDASLEKLLAKTQQKSRKLRTLLNSLTERTVNEKKQADDALLKAYSTIRGEMKEMEKRLSTVISTNSKEENQEIAKIKEDSKLSQSKIDEQFISVSSKFSEIDSKFENNQKELKNLFDNFLRKTDEIIVDRNNKSQEQTNKALQKVRLELQQAIDKMKEMTNELNSSISEVSTKSDQITIETRNVVDKSAKETKEYVDTLKDAIQAKFNHTKKKIESTNATIEEAKTEYKIYFQNADGKFNTANKRMDDVKDSVSQQMKSTVEDVNSSISKINAQFDLLKKANQESSESNLKMVEKALRDARSQLEKESNDRADVINSGITSLQTDMKSKTDSIISDIHDIQEYMKSSIRPKIKSIQSDYDEFRQEYLKFKTDTSSTVKAVYVKFDESSKFVSGVEEIVQMTENKMTDFAKSVKSDFIAARQDIDSVANRASMDVAEMRATVDAVRRDLLDLNRIKHFNAEYEQINMRFEDAMASLQKFQRTIYSFVLPDHQDMPNISATVKGKNMPDKRLQRIMQKEPLKPSSKDIYLIEDVEKDSEIGEILRGALKKHSYVQLLIPEKMRVFWNKSVSLMPNQSLFIQGERMSSIVMEGVAQFGEMLDISRTVIDGFGSLRIKNVKVQAQCAVPQTQTCLDLNALFVARCWDASGPGSILLESCTFEVDVPLVNIGANAFAHVKIADSTMTTRSRSQNTIFPITCESGGYSQGYGSVSIKNVNISRPRIQWLESPYLVQPDIPND